ncbi:MAG: hypothetical protein ACLFPI_01125 [Desulfobacterales bacterium]
MGRKGVHGPDHEQDGGILDIPPPGLPVQTAGADPVDEKAHGNKEKDMGKLVHNQPFRVTVGLGGTGRQRGRQQGRNNDEKGGFTFHETILPLISG